MFFFRVVKVQCSFCYCLPIVDSSLQGFFASNNFFIIVRSLSNRLLGHSVSFLFNVTQLNGFRVVEFRFKLFRRNILQIQWLYQIGNCDPVTFHERDGQNISGECFHSYCYRLLKKRWKRLQMTALLKMQLILMQEEWPWRQLKVWY